jgi:hypothetical protein
MFNTQIKRLVKAIITLSLTFATALAPLTYIKAADHAESTSVATDYGADIGDTFAFLNPTDNTKVVLGLTFQGFIVPGEALNLGFFSSEIVYRFEIENSGDAVADRFIDVTFSPQTSRSVAQTATIVLTNRRGGRAPIFNPRFTAPTTLSTFNATPNPFVVTTDSASGISFFAGLTDDPFYFDIPGFNRFLSSVTAGSPNPDFLKRSRDTFAGYNIHSIVVQVPANLLRSSAGNVIGVNGVTLRPRISVRQNSGQTDSYGDLVQVDRMATPAVNTFLLPFSRKNEYNAATPQDDASGLFANSIVASLTSLGTNSANIGILASVAVTNGDYLRLNLATPNSSQGFGERVTSPNYTGFPNGRRFGDDTVDTLTYFITNTSISTGDNVNSNEKQLTNTFPFLGLPHQPLENPAVDPTQNKAQDF